jgi:3-methyladenine DNA glycosylase AlkD
MSERDPIADVRAEVDGKAPSLAKQTTAEIRDMRRAWSVLLKDAPARAIVDFACELVERKDVPHFVAFEFVQNHAAALASITADDLKRLGKGLDSWSAVDAFSCYVAGLAWRAGQIENDEIERWTESPDRWWRRAALVATVPLNSAPRSAASDSARTIHICEALVDDRDDMVVKALSWALRALAKREPAPVGRFLAAHGDRVPMYVYRDVANVLRAEAAKARGGDGHRSPAKAKKKRRS